MTRLVEPDMVEKLICLWRRLSEKEGFPIAQWACRLLMKIPGASKKLQVAKAGSYVEKRAIITSGSLIDLAAMT